MILIGQYDSPFVRRVGLTLTFYGLAFEHRPWGTFGDAEKLAAVNPLMRVPTLVTDDGLALVETASIIDYLDSMVAPEKRLLPQREPLRHQTLRTVSFAAGVSDKAVSLFYELQLHDTPSTRLSDRLSQQISGGLQEIEKTAASARGGYLHGNTLTQADLAVTCMWRHFSECHPKLVKLQHVPHLMAHAARFEAMAEFKAISQPFIPPR
jgi:glutathione S-transferase